MLVKELGDIDFGQHGVHVAKVGVEEFLTCGRIYHSETTLGFSVFHARFVHVGSSGFRNEVVLCTWYASIITDIQDVPIAMIITLIKKISVLRRAHQDE